MNEEEWLGYLHAAAPSHGLQTHLTKAVAQMIEWLAKQQKQRSRWKYVTSSSFGAGGGAAISIGGQGGSIELEDSSSPPVKIAVDYGWIMAGVGAGLKIKGKGIGAGGSAKAQFSYGELFQHEGVADFEPAHFDGVCCGLYAEAVALEGLYIACILLGVSDKLERQVKAFELHHAKVMEALKEHTLNPIKSLQNLYHAVEHYVKMMQASANAAYIITSPEGPFRGVLFMTGDGVGLISASANIFLGGTRHRLLK